MALYETIFLLQFLLALTILGVKLYNLFSKGKIYDLRVSLMLFIGYFIIYAIGFVVMVLNYSNLLILQLFQLEQWFISLNIVFLIAELFFLFMQEHDKEQTPQRPYYANQKV